MEARRLERGLRLSEVNDPAGFLALREEWDTLARTTGDQVFHRHRFLSLWMEHFAPDARLRILTARGPDGALAAALPLHEERTTLLGMPVRQLASTANAHSCRFDMLAHDAGAAADCFLEHLCDAGGWDVLLLHDVPAGGRGNALVEAASRAGLPTGTWASQRSPFLPLPGTFEQLSAGLERRFRSNLRRRRRRLAEQGRVELEVVTAPEGLDAKLAEAFALERSGWKGENGTAIAQAPETLAFYCALAHAAAAEGTLALFFLRLDGRAIAFQLSLVDAGRLVGLKAGYDEQLAEYGPGQLLIEDSLRVCIERGLSALDMCGDAAPYKLEWTEQLLPHAWLYVFPATPLGRALCTAKFGLVPAAKAAVGWLTRGAAVAGERA